MGEGEDESDTGIGRIGLGKRAIRKGLLDESENGDKICVKWQESAGVLYFFPVLKMQDGQHGATPRKGSCQRFMLLLCLMSSTPKQLGGP